MLVAKKATIILIAFAVALLLFLSTSVGISAPVQKAEALANRQQQADCSEVISSLLAEEGGFLENLANPVLTSEKQVQGRVTFYQEVKPCLSNLEGILPSDDLELVETLVDRFLIFVGGTGQRIERVDLATTNDPAIAKLRDEIRVAPPEGFVYVNYFRSRAEVPISIDEAFSDPRVAAATFPFRFIAVLEELDQQGKVSQKVVSHELVHAYVLADLGVKNNLPKWFHEGLATYLSGSEEGSGSSLGFLVDELARFGAVETIEPIQEDYSTYNTIFRYLRSKLGEQTFNAAIKGAIKEGSADIIFRATGHLAYFDLAAGASSWDYHQRVNEQLKLALIVLGVIIAIGVLGWLLAKISA